MAESKIELKPGEATADVKKAARDASKRMEESADAPTAAIVNPPTKATAPKSTAAKGKGKGKPVPVMTNEQADKLAEAIGGPEPVQDGPSTVQDAPPAAEGPTDAGPAADASDAKSGGKKGGKKSSAVPSKNVNPRRVFEPKPTPTPFGIPEPFAIAEPTGIPAVPGTPVESVQAAPAADAPKRGRGRPPGSTNRPKGGNAGGTGVPAVILPTGPLTDLEASRLRDLESVVARGMESFLLVGNALIEIKTGALYRATHADYENYLRDRWDISPRQERHLTGGVVARKVLESAGVTDLPTNESQTRFLVGVPDEKKPAAWNLAIEKAKADGRETPTRDHVRAAADEIGRVSPRAGQSQPRTSVQGASVPTRTASEVARAQAAGVLPENVVIDVTPPAASDEPDDGLTDGPREDVNIDDSQWLEQFSIRQRLSERCRQIFDADATAYRWIDDARRSFIRNAFRPVLKQARTDSAQWLGPYVNRMLYTLRTAHPSKWVVCPSCQGSGQREGGKGECGDCKKCGYRLP